MFEGVRYSTPWLFNVENAEKIQNNRKSAHRSKLIKDKMPKYPKNERNITPESRGNSFEI